MYLVWIRPQWAAMFRIFHEQETSRKISHLTPDHCVYKTKAFPCSCAEKIDTPDSCPRVAAEMLTGMAMSPWGGQEAQGLWSTPTLPWAAHLGTARVPMLPSPWGLCHLQVLGHLWGSPPCPAEEPGDNSLPGLWNFFLSSPTAWQKDEQSRGSIHLQANKLLPDMPACTFHGQQFSAYSFLPDIKLVSQPKSCKKDYSLLSLL